MGHRNPGHPERVDARPALPAEGVRELLHSVRAVSALLHSHICMHIHTHPKQNPFFQFKLTKVFHIFQVFFAYLKALIKWTAWSKTLKQQLVEYILYITEMVKSWKYLPSAASTSCVVPPFTAAFNIDIFLCQEGNSLMHFLSKSS